MQRRGIGGGRRAGAPARFDDAVEVRRDETAAENDVLPFKRDHEAARSARRIGLALLLGDVLGCLTVTRRRDEVLKDPRRAHDLRLLGMREGNLNDLDPEQRGVWGRVNRSDRTTLQLVR